MVKRKAKPVENPKEATIFSRAIYDQIQSWRGDIRLDEWYDHFLSSLAHSFWRNENAIYLSEKQVEKLNDISEIIAGYAPPARPLHPDDIEGEIVDWENEGRHPRAAETQQDADYWQHAQRAAKRRIAAGAPLASNLWWEPSLRSSQTRRRESDDNAG